MPEGCHARPRGHPAGWARFRPGMSSVWPGVMWPDRERLPGEVVNGDGSSCDQSAQGGDRDGWSRPTALVIMRLLWGALPLCRAHVGAGYPCSRVSHGEFEEAPAALCAVCGTCPDGTSRRRQGPLLRCAQPAAAVCGPLTCRTASRRDPPGPPFHLALGHTEGTQPPNWPGGRFNGSPLFLPVPRTIRHAPGTSHSSSHLSRTRLTEPASSPLLSSRWR